MDAERIVGLLAEDERRRVVAALVLGASTVTDIARTAALTNREAAAALTRLVQGGLVETNGSTYVVLGEAFKVAARSHTDLSPEDFDDVDATAARVLRRSFTDGRLTHIPAKHSKRRVVLDHIVQRFEPGLYYTERQVNALLAPICDDVASVRRSLVDEELLDRANGEYWRCGGSV